MASASIAQPRYYYGLSFEDLVASYLVHLGFDGGMFKSEIESKGHYEPLNKWKAYCDHWRCFNPTVNEESSSQNSVLCRKIYSHKFDDFPDHKFDPNLDTMRIQTTKAGQEIGEVIITTFHGNKTWNAFHQFVFDWLKFLGYHGMDFKTRCLDPKFPEYDRILRFLDYCDRVDVDSLLFNFNDLGDFGHEFTLGEITAAEIAPEAVPPPGPDLSEVLLEDTTIEQFWKELDK